MFVIHFTWYVLSLENENANPPRFLRRDKPANYLYTCEAIPSFVICNL